MKKKLIAWTAIMAFVLIMTSCVTPKIADYAANKIYLNIDQELHREYPPTAQSIAFSADQQWIIGGRGMGISCSVPPSVAFLTFSRAKTEAPLSLQFRQACAYHDYCYRHGAATYGYTHAECDYLLQEHAYRLCKHVYGEDSQNICLTNARKVLLGVRVGGASSFKKNYSSETESPSTFFEFDPQPAILRKYSVVRIADASRNKGGKAIYLFDLRPSGMRVQELIMQPNGGFSVKPAFTVPGAYSHLVTAPIVVRDGPGSPDWFVWWQRESMNDTGGRLVFLRPKTASLSEWERVYSQENENCKGSELLPEQIVAKTESPSVIHCKEKDLNILQVVAVEGSNDGVLELIAQSSSSCGIKIVSDDGSKKEGNKSPCFVTYKFRPQDSKLAHKYHRMHLAACASGKGCDRYRNIANPPAFFRDGNDSGIVNLRRGPDATGSEYSEKVSLNAYYSSFSGKLCEPSESDRCAIPIKTLVASEHVDPIQPLWPEAKLERLIAFQLAKPDAERGPFFLLDYDLTGEKQEVDPLRCKIPNELTGDWLAIPPQIVRLPDSKQHVIVLTRRLPVTLPELPTVDSIVATIQFAHQSLPERGCPSETWVKSSTHQILVTDIPYKLPDIEKLSEREKGKERKKLSTSVSDFFSDPVIVARGLNEDHPERLYAVSVSRKAPSLTRWWDLGYR